MLHTILRILQIAQVLKIHGRLAEELPFESDCTTVRRRIIDDHPAPKINYSVAYVTNVYTDYESLAIQLSATYSPENHYCYHIDSKATPKFRKQILKLQQCFRNVYVTKARYDVTSQGRNNNIAHLRCMRILLTKKRSEYLITLQAHDVVAHTNLELSKMLK
ncbi:unnamed protein product, partial [Mesorhabditis spiculigera]